MNRHLELGTHLLDEELLEAAREELGYALSASADDVEAARCQNFLVLVHLERGDFHAGLAAASEAVALARRDADLLLVSSLNRLVALAEAGQLQEALALIQELDRRLAPGAGSPALLAHFQFTAANVALELGHVQEAARRAESVLRHERDADPFLLGLAELTRAIVDIEERAFGDALRRLERSAGRIASRATPRHLAHIETERARALFGLGETLRALDSAILALDLLLRDPAFVDWLELGRVAILLAAVLERLGEPGPGERLYAKGATWLARRGRRVEPVSIAGRVPPARAVEAQVERLADVFSYLEALLAEGDGGPARVLAHHAYYVGGDLTTGVSRSLMEQAAYHVETGQPLPPPPLPSHVQEALNRIRAFLADPLRPGAPRESQVLAVLAPYAETTAVDGSYIDALNDLLRRSRREIELELVDRFVQRHLLPEERRGVGP